MGQIRRLVVAAGGFIANTILALIYVRAAAPLLQMSTTGEFQGPFSPVSELALVIPAVVIGLLYLALAAWVIAGPVQEETARTVRAGGPRR
jgi:multisubunit Na+/H+ antiporter MnhC subunit